MDGVISNDQIWGSGQGGDTIEACTSKCDSIQNCCAFKHTTNWGSSGALGEHVCIINICSANWTTTY
jgi:hypothetical protein